MGERLLSAVQTWFGVYLPSSLLPGLDHGGGEEVMLVFQQDGSDGLGEDSPVDWDGGHTPGELALASGCH